jgi:hypothetical protein
MVAILSDADLSPALGPAAPGRGLAQQLEGFPFMSATDWND